MNTNRLFATMAIPVALAMPAQAAQQAAFPDKPIRLIIGSAPGSGPDIISRVMAERLYKTWGQRVVVDSRPGAAGVISAELALRANPDGYTWMMLTSQLLVATSVFPDVKFNLGKDFASVSLIGTVPFVLMVNPEAVPAKSVSELIEFAKKQPGKLRYGSAGTGASEHLCGVMFTRLTGTEHAARAVQGRSPGHCRHGGERGAAHLRGGAGRAAHDHGRAAAGAGRHQPAALAVAARRADHRGNGARLRHVRVVQHRRPHRHAASRSSTR